MRRPIVQIFLILTLSFKLQAQEGTEEPIPLTPSPIATLIPSATLTSTTIPNETPTQAPSLEPSLIAEQTEEPVEPTSTPTVTVEVTASPEVTDGAEETPLPANPTATIDTSQPTAIPSPSETASITPIVPTMMSTPTPISSITPTATLGSRPMVFKTGLATYQNRLPDNLGIEIHILDMDLVLLSVAQTDEQGNYSIAVPEAEAYWLVADAPLHKPVTLHLEPDTHIPAIALLGGDLNHDNCIGRSDVNLLMLDFETAASPTTDISGDGITDSSDLAIVTGNFDPLCEIPPATPVPTATPASETTQEVALLTPIVVIETIAPTEATSQPTQTPLTEVIESVEVTQQPQPEITDEPEITEEPEATSEVEATSMNTPQSIVTAEVTDATLTPTATPFQAETTAEPTLLSNEYPTK